MIKKLLKTSKIIDNKAFLKQLLNSNFNEDGLKEILKSEEVDINYLNENNETFLHICLRELKFKSAMWLISNNISVDIEDKDGLLPFDIAVEKQKHRIVKMLLDLTSVDLDKKDKFGRTLLQDAVVLGDHEMARILLEHGADINSKDNKNRNVMYDALSYGNEEFIDYLLNFKELDLNNIDVDDNTIMHHKMVKNNDKLAMKLIENGAKTTIKDKNGDTFLCYTALRGMEGIEVVDAALKKGCDVNSRVADENSILMELIAVASKLTSDERDRRSSLLMMCKELLEQGIEINALNVNNENALFKAIRNGNIEQVSFLLRSGIDVNVQNNDGETSLSLAVYDGIEKLDITLMLINHGADPTIMNQDAKTLYEVLNDIILHNHGNKIITDDKFLGKIKVDGQYLVVLKEILSQNEKDLNYLDSQGKPLFFIPMLYNNIHLFKMYMKAGLNVHNTNKDGQNLFFEYVLKVFEDDNEKIDFQSALSILVSARVDHNTIDETGWTVVSKVIGTTTCNIKLFKTLIKIVRFNYKVVDKLGRTAIHTAVWSSNLNVVKIVNYIDKDIKDTPDNYGILPIIYAALLGDRRLVMLFIDLKAKLRTDIPVSVAAIKKFTPMLKNLDKLRENVEDKDKLGQIDKVISQVRKNFDLKDI